MATPIKLQLVVNPLKLTDSYQYTAGLDQLATLFDTPINITVQNDDGYVYEDSGVTLVDDTTPKVFTPHFETIRFIIMEMNNPVKLTLTDVDGAKELRNITKLFITFGQFTQVEVVAETTSARIRVLMVGGPTTP